MKSTLINKERNEYRFELNSKEAAQRIYNCLKPTNPTLKVSDIKRCKNSKEYRAEFVNQFGEETVVSIGIGNLKRYFGSRLIKLKDDGGIEVRRIVTQKILRKTPLTEHDDL